MKTGQKTSLPSFGTGKRGHYERGLFAGRISRISKISRFSRISRKWSDSPLFSRVWEFSKISRISKSSRISRKWTFLKRPLFQKTPFSEPCLHLVQKKQGQETPRLKFDFSELSLASQKKDSRWRCLRLAAKNRSFSDMCLAEIMWCSRGCLHGSASSKVEKGSFPRGPCETS